MVTTRSLPSWWWTKNAGQVKLHFSNTQLPHGHVLLLPGYVVISAGAGRTLKVSVKKTLNWATFMFFFKYKYQGNIHTQFNVFLNSFLFGNFFRNRHLWDKTQSPLWVARLLIKKTMNEWIPQFLYKRTNERTNYWMLCSCMAKKEDLLFMLDSFYYSLLLKLASVILNSEAATCTNFLIYLCLFVYLKCMSLYCLLFICRFDKEECEFRSGEIGGSGNPALPASSALRVFLASEVWRAAW